MFLWIEIGFIRHFILIPVFWWFIPSIFRYVLLLFSCNFDVIVIAYSISLRIQKVLPSYGFCIIFYQWLWWNSNLWVTFFLNRALCIHNNWWSYICYTFWPLFWKRCFILWRLSVQNLKFNNRTWSSTLILNWKWHVLRHPFIRSSDQRNINSGNHRGLVELSLRSVRSQTISFTFVFWQIRSFKLHIRLLTLLCEWI